MRVLLALALVLAVSAPGRADAVYRGEETLWQDTVWQGEVLIDGILTVAPEATLEIRPGTVVRFTRSDTNADRIGEHELFIQGTFIARGTPDAPILFTSAETHPAPGDWGAINMMASREENVLEHCRVEYGYRGFHAHFAAARLLRSSFRFNLRGAQFQESTVVIADCRFSGNLNGIQFRDSTVTLRGTRIEGGYWGLRCVYSDIEMSGCVITGNRVNGAHFRDSRVTATGNRITGNRRGLYLQRSTGTLSGNAIDDNSEHGIFLEDAEGVVERNEIAGNGRSGIRVINSRVAIVDNAIVDNDAFALINDGDRDLEVAGNWWGTTDRQRLDALLRDGRDRPGTGFIVLAAPLAQPPVFEKGTE